MHNYDSTTYLQGSAFEKDAEINIHKRLEPEGKF